MEDLRNMTVSYSAINDTVSIFELDKNQKRMDDTTTLSYDRYQEFWRPHFEYTDPCPSKDNFEKAFKIAKMLLAEKILKSRKLSDFIGLVEMIAKEL